MRRLSISWSGLLRAAALGFGIGAAAGIIGFALSWASLLTDPDGEKLRVRAAFESGALQENGTWLKNDVEIGAHQWNDCLILFQAIDRSAPAAQLAVSPHAPLVGQEGPCPALHAYVSGGRPTASYFYHRYLHGHTTAVRLLLSVLSLAQIRALYSTSTTLLLMMGIAGTMLALARGAPVAAGTFWLIIFLTFTRWFGLESFGQSLSHGPSDLTIAAFLLFLGYRSARGGLSAAQATTAAAVFGALTIFFEFLTGGIPLGLTILIGGLPFALRPLEPAEQQPLPGHIVASAVTAFSAAILACVLVKAALLLSVFGWSAIAEIAPQLLFRMGLASHGSDALLGDRPAGVRDFAFGTLSGLASLAAGARPMAFLMLGVSFVAGVWGTIRLRRGASRLAGERATYLAASNLVLYLWLLVFWQHTAQHARFMDRILVWTIASGFALFGMAILSRQPQARSALAG